MCAKKIENGSKRIDKCLFLVFPHFWSFSFFHFVEQDREAVQEHLANGSHCAFCMLLPALSQFSVFHTISTNVRSANDSTQASMKNHRVPRYNRDTISDLEPIASDWRKQAWKHINTQRMANYLVVISCHQWLLSSMSSLVASIHHRVPRTATKTWRFQYEIK